MIFGYIYYHTNTIVMVSKAITALKITISHMVRIGYVFTPFLRSFISVIIHLILYFHIFHYKIFRSIYFNTKTIVMVSRAIKALKNT